MFIVSNISNAQIVSTFGGCGNSCTCVCDDSLEYLSYIKDPGSGIFDNYNNYYFVSGLGGNRIRKISHNGYITTIAGNGSYGYSGDGGIATNAQLNAPTCIRFDHKGNLFIADALNDVIRKVDTSTKIITTFAGTGVIGNSGNGGLAINANLNGPAELCFDRFGNLYFSDVYNYRIQKIDTNGYISTFVGNGIMGYSGDGGYATNAQIDYPAGLAIDDSGNFYFADAGSLSNRIRKIDKNGIITNFAGNGNGYYSNDGISATDASMNPAWINFDKYGNLFVADYYNKRIYYIDKNKILHWIGGNGNPGFNGDGQLATLTSFDFPSSVNFDSCGNLYITEADNNRIRKVTFPHCNYMDVNEVQNSTNENFTISPNPTTQYLYLSCNEPIENVYMCNAIGQKVFEAVFNQTQKPEIDIGLLPVGVYYVCVNKRHWGKAVKE